MSRGADVLGSWPEGVVLPPYSPWRRIPEWEPQGRWLRDRPQVEWPDTVFSVTRAPWLLRLMLAAGLALGLPTMGGGLGRHLLVVALTLVLWGWIGVTSASRSSGRPRTAWRQSAWSG